MGRQTEGVNIAAFDSVGNDVTAGMSVLEESGTAYDPTQVHLDLTKEEKRRTTALLLAIQAYNNLIIKDAEYLKEMHSEARREGAVIPPATMSAMVQAALDFDDFISGELQRRISASNPANETDAAQEPSTESTKS